MIFRKIGEKGEQVPGWEKKFAWHQKNPGFIFSSGLRPLI